MELAVGRKPERETLCFFPAKVAAAGNQGQFVCEAVAGTFLGSHTVTVASSCFGCVCVCARGCAQLKGVLDPVVADGSGMAA